MGVTIFFLGLKGLPVFGFNVNVKSVTCKVRIQLCVQHWKYSFLLYLLLYDRWNCGTFYVTYCTRTKTGGFYGRNIKECRILKSLSTENKKRNYNLYNNIELLTIIFVKRLTISEYFKPYSFIFQKFIILSEE